MSARPRGARGLAGAARRARGPARASTSRSRRRGAGPRRAQRRRQVHAGARAGRAAARRPPARCASRAGRSPPGRATRWPARSPLVTPRGGSAAAAHRRGARALGPLPAPRALPAPRPRRTRRRWRARSRRTGIAHLAARRARPRSPRASGSSRRWPAAWPRSRACCCSTSRPPTSTSATSSGSSACSTSVRACGVARAGGRPRPARAAAWAARWCCSRGRRVAAEGRPADVLGSPAAARAFERDHPGPRGAGNGAGGSTGSKPEPPDSGRATSRRAAGSPCRGRRRRGVRGRATRRSPRRPSRPGGWRAQCDSMPAQPRPLEHLRALGALARPLAAARDALARQEGQSAARFALCSRHSDDQKRS